MKSFELLLLISIILINYTVQQNTDGSNSFQDCQNFDIFQMKCGQILESPEGGCFNIVQEDLPDGWKLSQNNLFLEFSCNQYLVPEMNNDCQFCPTPGGARRVWKSQGGTPYCVIINC